MPRIRQLDDKYRKNDFLAELAAQCARKGFFTCRELGDAVDMSASSICGYRREPGKIRLDTMQSLVAVLKPDIAVVLRFLGYSEKDIRKFAELNSRN